MRRPAEELFRRSRGELHVPENLPVGSAHSPHHVDKVGVSGGKAAEQTDGHGEEAGDDNEYHLGQDSIAQPEYQQRGAIATVGTVWVRISRG